MQSRGPRVQCLTNGELWQDEVAGLAGPRCVPRIPLLRAEVNAPTLGNTAPRGRRFLQGKALPHAAQPLEEGTLMNRPFRLFSESAAPAARLRVQAVQELHRPQTLATAAMLAAGADLQEAVRIANRAGGIVVGKLGTASVSYKELFEGEQ